MRIYLVGYMYSGKTTVGRLLAKRCGYQFLDLDQAIEQRYHTTIPLFFQKYGEPLFRQIESQMLHATASLDNIVISTGGGTPCHNDNMAWILSHGTSIYLSLPAEDICARMSVSRKRRPTLASLPPEERQQFVRHQLQERILHYSQASHTIEIRHLKPENIVEQIQKTLLDAADFHNEC